MAVNIQLREGYIYTLLSEAFEIINQVVVAGEVDRLRP
jgi:hypothetical protein